MVEQPRAETIFGKAIEIGPVGERNAFLDGACHGDLALRQDVDKLVHDYFRAGEFLEQPVAQIASPTIDQPITEKPGTQIGPYKLLQQIGEGGMGVVYMAEQKEPVKRRVALKIIKPGMDSRQVIARFEAERQALAMMDHPNIAKVLDAGQTESGRPYFVMELVNGLPVTKYCDEQHLTPKERLQLFVPICQAVQHAHHKGIIHRDLKPSNILVALYDGLPVPKIIDFGVAKATSQSLTEKTMFTELGQVVGTLEYMSPEQAERNQLDIDTRSDIYSLGVVLYELLTGETPLDRALLRSAAFDEMLRMIREEEPPRPSIRLSSSAQLPAIAAKRHVEASRLSNLIRGELDWIVMKALEKDRARRYDTAGTFAEDVKHYLNNEPVDACPPSRIYRFRKFARRNKAVLTTTALIGFVLIIGLSGISWQAYRATLAEADSRLAAIQAGKERDLAVESEKRAESERASARGALKYLAEVLEQAAPYREADRELKVRTLLDRAAARLDINTDLPPLVVVAIRQTLGRIYWGLGEFAEAESQLSRAFALHGKESGADHGDTLDTAYDLAMLYWIQSEFDKAQPLFEFVCTGKSKLLGPAHPETLRAMNGLGLIHIFRDETDYAEALYTNAMKNFPANSEDQNRKMLKLLIMRGLGLTRLQQERYDEAESLLTTVLEEQSRVMGSKHPETLITSAMLATLYANTLRTDEAEPLAVAAYEIRRKVFGDSNPHTLSSVGTLARVYLAQDRQDDAEPLLQSLLEQSRIQRDRLPPYTIMEVGEVGLALLKHEKYAIAEQFLQLSLEMADRRLPDGWRQASLRSALGASLAGQQKFSEAEPLLRQGYDGLRRDGNNIPTASRQSRIDGAADRLSKLHEAWEKPADARHESGSQ